MREHHVELGTHGVVFDLAHTSIRLGEAAGGIRFWVARCDQGRVVGYIVWYISEHPYSQGMLIAMQGPWFVTSSSRNSTVGLRLFKLSLRDLKLCGISLALPHHQLTPKAEGIADYFQRLGATPLEVTYLIDMRST